MALHGVQEIGVGVIVRKGDSILLGRRREGTWTIPGDVLLFGESFEEAVRRILLEEAATDISEGGLSVAAIMNDTAGEVQYIGICFVFDGVLTKEPSPARPAEIAEWKWFSPDDLPSPLFSPTEKALKDYLDKIIYRN